MWFHRIRKALPTHLKWQVVAGAGGTQGFAIAQEATSASFFSRQHASSTARTNHPFKKSFRSCQTRTMTILINIYFFNLYILLYSIQLQPAQNASICSFDWTLWVILGLKDSAASFKPYFVGEQMQNHKQFNNTFWTLIKSFKQEHNTTQNR